MRSATVVLPVPGLPVKLMCSDGRAAVSPASARSRSITSSAAISRMRLLTGASATSSRSSSSSTARDASRARPRRRRRALMRYRLPAGGVGRRTRAACSGCGGRALLALEPEARLVRPAGRR